jgi:hypothetical protein
MQTNPNQILLVGISPAFSAVLVDNVATYTGTGTDVFFAFNNYGGGFGSWTLESGNTVNDLAQIMVKLKLTYGSSQTLTFNTSINPRQGSKINAPRI